MSNKTPHVLYAGPDMRAQGGIASVLASYSRTLPRFDFMATNSHRGSVPGYAVFLATMAKLPLLRMKGFNVLHAHGAAGKSFVRKRMLLEWSRLLGFRTIYHCHAGVFADYSRRVGEARMSRMLGRFTAVVALTEGWKKYFTDTLGLKNVFVIQNIIEVPREEINPATYDGREPLRLLFMGKICKNKGVYDLLEAMAQPTLKGKVHLTIGGSGEEAQLRDTISRLGLSDSVDLAGWVGDEQKDALLRRSHIVVLPSYIEGMPICLLEAGVYGRPSISTTVGGIPEFIVDGQNGSLTAPGDVSALTEAIASYISTPEKVAQQGATARKMVTSFLPSAVASALDALHKNVMTI